MLYFVEEQILVDANGTNDHTAMVNRTTKMTNQTNALLINSSGIVTGNVTEEQEQLPQSNGRHLSRGQFIGLLITLVLVAVALSAVVCLAGRNKYIKMQATRDADGKLTRDTTLPSRFSDSSRWSSESVISAIVNMTLNKESRVIDKEQLPHTLHIDNYREARNGICMAERDSPPQFSTPNSAKPPDRDSRPQFSTPNAAKPLDRDSRPQFSTPNASVAERCSPPQFSTPDVSVNSAKPSPNRIATPSRLTLREEATSRRFSLVNIQPLKESLSDIESASVLSCG